MERAVDALTGVESRRRWTAELRGAFPHRRAHGLPGRARSIGVEVEGGLLDGDGVDGALAGGLGSEDGVEGHVQDKARDAAAVLKMAAPGVGVDDGFAARRQP